MGPDPFKEVFGLDAAGSFPTAVPTQLPSLSHPRPPPFFPISDFHFDRGSRGRVDLAPTLGSTPFMLA